jgi:hypothetical protein
MGDGGGIGGKLSKPGSGSDPPSGTLRLAHATFVEFLVPAPGARPPVSLPFCLALMVPHLDILPEEQLAIWEVFWESDLSGFILYGGTALALRYGHRLSVDFDFFTGLPVTPETVHQRLPWLAEHFESSLQLEANTFVFTTRAPNCESSSTVKLSFFGDLDLPVIQEPDIAPNDVSVASTKDLLATKLKVINQRIEAKDYLDIAEILWRTEPSGSTLEEGLANMAAIFPAAAPSETLKALCWFHGGDLDTLESQTKQFLERTVKDVGPLPPASIRPGITLKTWRRV